MGLCEMPDGLSGAKTLRIMCGPRRWANNNPYVLVASGSLDDLSCLLVKLKGKYVHYRLVPIGSWWDRNNPDGNLKLYVHAPDCKIKEIVWDIIKESRQ